MSKFTPVRKDHVIYFKCEDCENIFHNIVGSRDEMYPDLTDLRGIDILRIELQCPNCKAEGFLTLNLYAHKKK